MITAQKSRSGRSPAQLSGWFGRRFRRGEHRPGPGRYSVAEVKAGLREQAIVSEPVLIGEWGVPVRLWLPEGEPRAATLTCEPGGGALSVPVVTWDHDGRIFADGIEVELAPVERRLMRASIAVEERRQAAVAPWERNTYAIRREVYPGEPLPAPALIDWTQRGEQ